MECPYCKKEMEKGKMIGARSYLHYVPDNEQPPSWVWTKSRTGIAFKSESIFEPSKVIAFRCIKCEKIIIDIKNSNKKEEI